MTKDVAGTIFDQVVAFPAYNEEKAIGSLLEKTLASMPVNAGILVVDDGSTDRTASVVESFVAEHPVHLVRHGKNKGLAAAIRTLLTEATKRLSEDGQLVIMDADGSHSPYQIDQLRRTFEEGYDIVIASRYTAQSEIRGVSALRRSITTASRYFFRMILGPLPAKDLSCGFRMYRAGLIKSALDQPDRNLITVQGFCVTVELLVKLHWMGARIAEIPLKLRYDLKESPTRMKFFRTAMEYWRLLFTLRAESRRSKLNRFAANPEKQ